MCIYTHSHTHTWVCKNGICKNQLNAEIFLYHSVSLVYGSILKQMKIKVVTMVILLCY